jgi:hypothetical protein
MDERNVDGEALFDQAMAAIRANHPDAAQQLLIRVVRANPDHEQAWLLLSSIVTDIDQTIACLEKVLELNPNNAQAKEWLSFAQQSKAEESNAVPEKVAPNEPERPVAHLGKYLLDHGFITNAQLQAALQAQGETARLGQVRKIGEILVEQRAISRERLAFAVHEQQRDFFNLFKD